MAKHRRSHPSRGHQWINAAWGAVLGSMRRVSRSIRRWSQPVPVEVLLANQSRRRSLERELKRGVRQLQRVLGSHFPDDCVVVVQQMIQTDHQLAGCYQIGQRSEGGRFSIVRLALTMDGRSLSVDEVLAALSEQCISLAGQTNGPSVLVPIDLFPSVGRHPTPIHRADPLATRSNGIAFDQPVAHPGASNSRLDDSGG